MVIDTKGGRSPRENLLEWGLGVGGGVENDDNVVGSISIIDNNSYHGNSYMAITN